MNGNAPAVFFSPLSVLEDPRRDPWESRCGAITSLWQLARDGFFLVPIANGESVGGFESFLAHLARQLPDGRLIRPEKLGRFDLKRSVALLADGEPQPHELSPFDLPEHRVYGDLYNVPAEIRGMRRRIELERRTKETSIRIRLSLDGSGRAKISSGIPFFDHMLDQVAKHSGIDMEIAAVGDLDIDEHHTVEDIGLALGDAVNRGLGERVGISRYGFCLPMDEARALVAIDFSGRPYSVWDAEFVRERVGDLPTELVEHFFKSFSDTSRSTLHVQAIGKNDHHKIEGIFKAFGKALGQAIKTEREGELPSTKGVL